MSRLQENDLFVRLGIIAGGLTLFAIGGADVDLAILSFLVLAVGVLLFLRRGYSAILLLVVAFHWTGSSLGAVHAGLLGVDLDEVSEWPGRHRLAMFLMMVGSCILFLGMRAGAGRPQPISARAWARAQSQPLSTYFIIYAAAFVGSVALASLSLQFGSLHAPLQAVATLKWAAFVLLTMVVFSRPEGGRLAWAGVFMFELLLSLGGFFSSFKLVFFFTFVALWAAGFRLSGRSAIFAAAGFAVLLYLSVAWTAVKESYRDYVAGGTGQQLVLVGYEERVRHLYGMVLLLRSDDYFDGVEAVMQRLAYHGIFGAVLDRVPEAIPHSGGDIWLEAVVRPLMPRVLFPEKSVIYDTTLTNRYSGLGFSARANGTSISMGYMAEAYIDFGPFLMFVPIFLVGYGVGRVHRWLATSRHTRGVVGAALAPVALFPAMAIETSAIKLVGGFMLSGAAVLLASFVLVPFFMPWLQADRRVAPASPAGPVRNGTDRAGDWSQQRRPRVSG